MPNETRTEATNAALNLFHQYPMAEPIFYLLTVYLVVRFFLNIYMPE